MLVFENRCFKLPKISGLGSSVDMYVYVVLQTLAYMDCKPKGGVKV